LPPPSSPQTPRCTLISPFHHPRFIFPYSSLLKISLLDPLS
jgi:hypothetical protein